MIFVMTEKIQAIKHILATIFAAQNALRSLAPEFKWSGLGNLLGDYQKALSIANYSSRNNKYSISLTALKKLK